MKYRGFQLFFRTSLRLVSIPCLFRIPGDDTCCLVVNSWVGTVRLGVMPGARYCFCPPFAGAVRVGFGGMSSSELACSRPRGSMASSSRCDAKRNRQI